MVDTTQGVRRYQTTPDLIADALRADIQRGAVAPGHALRQEELARRFGVSRLPIRDALLRLESEGLVVVYPNRGAYVASLSAAEVREIYDLRVLLEGDILERAVPRATAADWRRIDAALAAAAAGAEGEEWGGLDRAFHLALYAPAQRSRHASGRACSDASAAPMRSAYAALPTRTPEWLRDHEEIVAAARADDAPAARQRLTAHLERAATFVVGQLERA